MVAEHDVLRDGERLDEPEVLVHHEDARVERVARRVEMNVAAAKEDLTLVRPVETREDVRERALAGAVLPEQRVHLADGRLEVDAVVRDDAGEALRDSAHRNGGRGAVGAPPVVPLGVLHQPFGLPITPFTSQFIAYRCFRVSFLPFGTRSLPLWS